MTASRATTSIAPGTFASPTGKTPYPYEQVFIDWLTSQGYCLEYEPHRLPLPPKLVTRKRYSGKIRHLRRDRPVSHPDLWIKQLPDGTRLGCKGAQRLYFELTAPQLAGSPNDLSPETRAKNRRHSDSGQEHVPIHQYLAYKQRRMELVARHNKVTIIVLDLDAMSLYAAHPAGLLEMIHRTLDANLVARSA